MHLFLLLLSRIYYYMTFTWEREKVTITTPYYLIDEQKLLRNLAIIRQIREMSGAKSLLALKCFAAWSVFGLMGRYMDGTTSSSLSTTSSTSSSWTCSRMRLLTPASLSL